MEDLKILRKEITEIDNEMADLFTRRMKLVAEVARYKQHKGLPVLDAKREEQVIAGGTARISDDELKPYYMNFLKETMKVSRSYQTKLLEGVKVAYCGTEGAFAHIAASHIFPKPRKSLIPVSRKPMNQYRTENVTALCCLWKTVSPDMWIR